MRSIELSKIDKGREDIDISIGGEYNIVKLLDKPVRKCVGEHLYLFNDMDYIVFL